MAKAYVATLRDLLAALGVSDVRMEQGSLRCDANVSLQAEGRRRSLGTRSETKNVNSLRSVERAVRYEITRHGGDARRRRRGRAGDPALARGHRRHDSGRVKYEAEDYRYFPEPDLVPVAPSRETVEALRGTLPEPPAARRRRLQADWGFADLEMRDVVNAGPSS